MAAKREFKEETGESITGEMLPLGSVRTSNKIIHAWAVESNPSTDIVSNTFEMEWPPKSGKKVKFPEVDSAAWFDLQTAREKIVKSQIPLLERLEELLSKN